MNSDFNSPIFKDIEDKLKVINDLLGNDPLTLVIKDNFQRDIAIHLTSLHDNKSNPYEEILKSSKTMAGPSGSDSKEIDKQIYINIGRTSSCVAFMFDAVKKPLELTDIHFFYEILFDDPKFRDGSAMVQTQSGDEVIFADHDHVSDELDELLVWFKKDKELHPLVKIALFNYKFLMIHPFSDGNGRIARLLMNIQLMSAGYLPILLDGVDKVDYYTALEEGNKESFAPLINLIANKQYFTINEFIKSPEYLSIAKKQELENQLKKIKGKELCFVLTEDKKYEGLLTVLFEASGFNMKETTFIAYEGCSKLDSVALFTIFTKEKLPHIKVVIHRDRDYLTDDEIEKQRLDFQKLGALFFVTTGTDAESHFANAEHINHCHSEISIEEAKAIINEAITEGKAVAIERLKTKEFGESHKKKFTHLEKQLTQLYEDRSFRFTLGKTMFKSISSKAQKLLKRNPTLLVPSKFVAVPFLQNISKEIWP